MPASSFIRHVASPATSLGCLTILLGGCSSLFGTSYSEVTCPSADIAGQVGSVSHYQGTPGNFANLAYSAELKNLTGTCDVDDTGVTVKVTFTTIAQAGPAAPGQTVDLPYFIAIVDSRDNVVFKKVFPNSISFSPAQHLGGATDTLEQHLPLANPREATGYHVMLGFQLSPEELAYNRAIHKTPTT